MLQGASKVANFLRHSGRDLLTLYQASGLASAIGIDIPPFACRSTNSSGPDWDFRDALKVSRAWRLVRGSSLPVLPASVCLPADQSCQ